MQGYLGREDETAAALQTHEDGKIWLHTGDIATMDEDGFFFFRSRLKRMIKSSGMNVYPGQVEEVLRRHVDVEQACVVGVPDVEQGERIKAFVVLRDPRAVGDGVEQRLIDHCRENLIKWSCPREIELCQDLPLTLVGKVDYRALQRQELGKLQETGERIPIMGLARSRSRARSQGGAADGGR